MVNKIGKKWLNILFFTYLTLTIIGSFAFSVNETFNFDSFTANKNNSSIYFSSYNYNVDWIAEETAAIRIISGRPPAMYRNGFIRIILPFGFLLAAVYLTKIHIHTKKNDKTFNIRSTILLKLRI